MNPTTRHLAIVSEQFKDDKTATQIADDFKLPLNLVLDASKILYKKPMFDKITPFKKIQNALLKSKNLERFRLKHNLEKHHLKAISEAP